MLNYKNSYLINEIKNVFKVYNILLINFDIV